VGEPPGQPRLSGGGSIKLLGGAGFPRFGSGGRRTGLGLDKPRVRERDEGPKASVIDAAEDADRTVGLVIPENADLELVRNP